MAPDGELGRRSLLALARMLLKVLEAATPRRSADHGNLTVIRMSEEDLNLYREVLRRCEQLAGAREVDASRVVPSRPTSSAIDATPGASRPPLDEMTAGVRRQARGMDLDMGRLARSYAGQYVAYHSGEVLGNGKTIDEALAPLDDSQRALPFVLRYVDADGEDDFMGGPKEG